VYSEADVERLQLLRSATLAGHSIGRIAHLGMDQLQELVMPEVVSVTEGGAEGEMAYFARPYLEQCLAAIESLDAQELDNTLSRALVHLGQPAIVDHVLQPLMNRIDELWVSGALRIAHEHLASAIVRVFLSSLARTAHVEPLAPVLIATTPARQVHEVGALMVAAMAAHQGWKVIYLGPNLPAEEIALAVEKSGAIAIALSVVYPADDTELPGELRRLAALLKLIPVPVVMLVGGRAAAGYADTLDSIGAIRITDMQSLRLKLQQLRNDGGRRCP
jgi:methanogenic corrinoid protein MtbC1